MARKFRMFVRLIAAVVLGRPIRVGSGRRKMWFWPSQNVLLPVIEGGSPEGDPDPEPDPKPADPKPDDPQPDDDPDPKPDPKPKSDEDWKRESRKHERRTKQTRDVLASLAAGDSIGEAAKKAGFSEETVLGWLPDDVKQKIKDREDAQKTEQQKAIDKARADATAEAEGKFEATRRDDKIEQAVTKLSLGGFKVEVDGEEKTLKFEDPDDAQLRIDRALRDGDLEYDDIYSDGKVKTDAVKDFLSDVLAKHPRLQAGDSGAAGRKVEGSADGGKGAGPKDPDATSVEDELKKVRRRTAA